MLAETTEEMKELHDTDVEAAVQDISDKMQQTKDAITQRVTTLFGVKSVHQVEDSAAETAGAENPRHLDDAMAEKARDAKDDVEAQDAKEWVQEKGEAASEKVHEVKDAAAEKTQKTTNEHEVKDAASEKLETKDDVAEKAHDAKEWMQNGESASEHAHSSFDDQMQQTKDAIVQRISHLFGSSPHTAGDAKDAAAQKAHDTKDEGDVAEKAQEAKGWMQEKGEAASEKAHDTKDAASEKAHDAKEWVQEKGEAAAEKAHELKDAAAEKAHDAKEWVQEKGEAASEKAHEVKDAAGVASFISGTAHSALGYVTEKMVAAKESAVAAKDLVFDKTSEVKDTVAEKANGAYEYVADQAAAARDVIAEQAHNAHERAEEAKSTAADQPYEVKGAETAKETIVEQAGVAQDSIAEQARVAQYSNAEKADADEMSCAPNANSDMAQEDTIVTTGAPCPADGQSDIGLASTNIEANEPDSDKTHGVLETMKDKAVAAREHIAQTLSSAYQQVEDAALTAGHDTKLCQGEASDNAILILPLHCERQSL